MGGETNGQISAAHKTAFTPAGYAFSIWGIIYTMVSLFCIFQCLPSRRAWTESVVGWRFVAVNLSNMSWLLFFGFEVGGQWVSSVVLFGGLLAPLVWLHRRFRVGDLTRRVSVPELICAHGMVSLYAGWCCVACIANVAIALTPRGPVPASLGWTPAGWSVLMQVVAVGLAGTYLSLYNDWVFAAPIAWALVAIGVQQRSSAYPGGPDASNAGFVLGALLGVAALLTALRRLWLWRTGASAPFAAFTAEAGVAEESGDAEGGSVKLVDDAGLYASRKSIETALPL